MNDAEFFITKLGLHQHTIENLEEVTTGVGGAKKYKLQVHNRPLFMKHTPADSPDYIYQKGLVEYYFHSDFCSFYETQAPELLHSLIDSEHGIFLMFPLYRICPPPSQWDKILTEKTLEACAKLHAAFWGRTDSLKHYPWLTAVEDNISTEMTQDALELWNKILDKPSLSIDKSSTKNMLDRLFGNIEKLQDISHSMPKTVCHGDFHMENILLDSVGTPLLSDWQEVCISSGPNDISFFLNRAKASGASLAEEDAVAYYVDKLEKLLGNQIGTASVNQVISASSILTSLIHWPHYLSDASIETIEAVLSDLYLHGKRLHLI